MKLLFIVGDPAVGKMTVGQELMKLSDLRLFHNHMTIDLVLEVFGGFNGSVIKKLREVIFEDFAKSDQYGMIFTGVWYFDHQEDWDYIKHICDIFSTVNSEIYYVELVASQDVRLQRNITENRLLHKPSKRDIESSNRKLLNNNRRGRSESYDGEIPFENYIKIDNTNLPPDEVAKMIKDHFSL